MHKLYKVAAFLWVAALSTLFVVSCVNSGDSSTPEEPSGTGGVGLYGTFRVALTESTETSNAYTSLLGRVANGPTPSVLAWTDTDSAGVCRLRIPHAPSCIPGCGSAAACVADGVCQAYPKGLDAGTVTVNGLKVSSGGTSFTMSPLFSNYQPPAGTTLDFPPFEEGGILTVSSPGKDTVVSFTLTAKGIKPLKVLYDSVPFVDGQPATLQWEAKGSSGTSAVSVEVDISHHGGLKGVISCEGPDNGELVIPTSLITKLKALGMSGFPSVEMTRYVSKKNAGSNLELRIESRVSRPVYIPGVVSCNGDEDCPDNQTCQEDFKCQ